MSTNNLRETAVPTPAAFLQRLAYILLVALFVVAAYTFLHEAGHAVVGLAFGQTLTAFNLNFWDLSAHVRLVGDLTPAQRAVQSVAGVSLPLLVWALFISLTPRRANLSLEVLKLISAVTVINTLLPWIIIPVLDLMGYAPAADDVTYFLRASQMPPLLVTAVAASLYALGWALYLAKSEGLRAVFLRIRQAEAAEFIAHARFLVVVMIALLVLGLVTVLAINNVAAQNANSQLAPPDLQQAAQIELSSRAYEGEPVAQIHLDETATLSVFFLIRNIDTPYFDLSLSGPDGYQAVVLHGEDFRTDSLGASALQAFTLPPGEYRLVLTARQSPGELTVQWGFR